MAGQARGENALAAILIPHLFLFPLNYSCMFALVFLAFIDFLDVKAAKF